jgi:hypothetical protein
MVALLDGLVSWLKDWPQPQLRVAFVLMANPRPGARRCRARRYRCALAGSTTIPLYLAHVSAATSVSKNIS